MDIERGNSFPFYTFPWVKELGNKEDRLLNFGNELLKTHEDQRSLHSEQRSFYQRASYMIDNWFRFQNDTVANCTWETQLAKPQYDRLNSIIRARTAWFYGALTSFHALSFMGLCYAFRYRRVGLLPAAGIAAVYSVWFSVTSNIGYKMIVDSKVNSTVESWGHGDLVQSHGSLRRLKY